jgi:hypothetical protein
MAVSQVDRLKNPLTESFAVPREARDLADGA